MNMRLQTAVALALIGLGTVAITQPAAACGINLVKTADGHWTVAPLAQMKVSPTRRAFLQALAPAATTHALRNPLQFMAPIAGLYQVTLTAEGNGPTGMPDGALIDHGYVAWHADGTEIMNSGRPAGDANFCLGTWARIGPRTYQLNHFMLSWAQFAGTNPDGPPLPPSPPLPSTELYYVNNEFVGPANIQETITLSPDGNSYTGTFVLTQYDTSYNIVLPGGIPIKGTVSGTRETVDSPVTY